MYHRYFMAFATFLLISLNSYAHEWVDPTPCTPTSYVYAPGVLSSEILMGRYCPIFVASTGQVVTCTKGIEVIRLPATSSNLTEISLKQINRKERKRKRNLRRQTRTRRQSFISLLLTPFRAFWCTASYCANFFLGLSVKTPKNSPKPITESLHMYWADPTKVSLAQEKDLELFKATYDNHLSVQDKTLRQKVVLYGTSRGSATVFNFGALYNPQEVHAIVCEGLFDSMEHVAKASPSRRVRWLISLLPKVSDFNHEGILPIKLVDVMSKDIPILLITSYKDEIVPYECTLTIYNKLRAAGHNKVHILVLNKATHVWYPHCKESALYEQVVHAFYKHYDLPYIPQLAEQGHEHFITMTQPEFEIVQNGGETIPTM